LDRPIGLLVYEEFLKRKKPGVRALYSLMGRGEVVRVNSLPQA
jgi:hypothetical protein